MSTIDEEIEIMLEYAMRFVNLPYIWGGQSPFLGYDCSGFVQECLASIGKDPRGDQTAASLYNYLKVYTRPDILRRGSILYFGKSKDKITHVALALSPRIMIEAGGGGSKTLTAEDAKALDARVRVRPIRNDLVAFQNLY